MDFLRFIFVISFLVSCWCHISATFKSDSDVNLRFKSFKEKFGRTYESPLEEERRFRIFRANLMKIQSLNEVERGTAVHGVTQFADYSKSEFRKYFLGLNAPAHQSESAIKPAVQIPKLGDTSLPINYDWRAYNAVTPIKNQISRIRDRRNTNYILKNTMLDMKGMVFKDFDNHPEIETRLDAWGRAAVKKGMCGSCWAFSVTGNIEGQYAIKHKSLLSFSEQELVDCDKIDNGCGGGYMTDAYKVIEKLGGLELESDYPYEGRNDQCHLAKRKIKVKVSGYQNITANETEMAYWLYEHGPISIGLNAFAMQFYFGGISHPLKFLCNPADIDHGVLLVGFGIQKTKFTRKMQPYWLIKNSWGAWWGERGYYKLYRGSGACGVDQMASSALVE